MSIHREGYKIIGIASLLFGVTNIISFSFLSGVLPWVAAVIFIITFLLLIFTVSFFRIPERKFTIADDKIICPADGKVVAIEEMHDGEYFHDRRIQVSIFMSPANIHVNLNPVSGTVKYSHYHHGRYLVAWHPKSSLENERHSVVIENEKGAILVKQIAGAMAKRICNYATVGQQVIQDSELGFIKFGSRVDVLLPLSAAVEVRLNQSVKCGVTILASF